MFLIKKKLKNKFTRKKKYLQPGNNFKKKKYYLLHTHKNFNPKTKKPKIRVKLYIHTSPPATAIVSHCHQTPTAPPLWPQKESDRCLRVRLIMCIAHDPQTHVLSFCCHITHYVVIVAYQYITKPFPTTKSLTSFIKKVPPIIKRPKFNDNNCLLKKKKK